jgi:hypothetical protein
MRRLSARLTALTALALGASVVAGGCAKHSGEEPPGSLQLALTVPGAFTLQTVDYRVFTASNANFLVGTFNVSDPNAAVALDLALAAGHYDIALTAHTNPGSPTDHVFSGSTATATPPGFNILSGQTTIVNLTLSDAAVTPTPATGIARVSATVVPNDNAPVIDSVVVAPAQTSVNASIDVKVVAHDQDSGDTITYLWTATDGAFAAPTSAITTYSSPSGGSKTLTITVTDSRGSSVAVQLPVTIIGPVVGSGGATGTGGAGTGGAGTGGSATGGSSTGGASTGGSGTGGAATGGASTGGSGTGGAATGGASTGGSGTGGAATGGASTGGSGTGGATTGGADGSLALQTAELATPFDANLLTYTHTQDPDTGDQVPVGWGPSTLPSQQQRDAATALIRRIAALLPNSVRNSTNTANATPGTGATGNVPNPLNGLLTLGADPGSLISGSNLAPAAGTALEAFRAAAIADTFSPAALTGDPGGLTPAQAASNGTLGAYLAGKGVDPGSAVGIAVNVVTDAVQFNLVSQLQAF